METLERPCGFYCPRDPNESPNTSHIICPKCAQILKDQIGERRVKRLMSEERVRAGNIYEYFQAR